LWDRKPLKATGVFSGPKTPTEEKNEKMRKSKKNNAEEEKM
jgi:hypothetical protein